MKQVMHDHKETLSLENGVIYVKGRSSKGKDQRKRTLKSLVQEAFAHGINEGPLEVVSLLIGSGFDWDIEPEEVANFDEVIRDMMDESDFPWNERGELEIRVRLYAIA